MRESLGCPRRHHAWFHVGGGDGEEDGGQEECHRCSVPFWRTPLPRFPLSARCCPMGNGSSVAARLERWARSVPRRALACRSFDCSCAMSTRQSARRLEPRSSHWGKQTTCRHRLSTVGQSVGSQPRHGKPLRIGSMLTRRMRTSVTCSTGTWQLDACSRASRQQRSYRCSANRTPTIAGASCITSSHPFVDRQGADRDSERRYVVAADPPRSGSGESRPSMSIPSEPLGSPSPEWQIGVWQRALCSTRVTMESRPPRQLFL